MKKTAKKINGSGQVMLISVLILGSLMLGSTVIAGYITSLRIRQSGDVTDSAKAIFAADAGLEHSAYRCFHKDPPECNDIPATDLGNGASYTVTIVKDGLGEVTEIRSVGRAGKTSRALRFRL